MTVQFITASKRLYLKYDSGSQTWKLQRDHKHTSSKYPAGRATRGLRIFCEARECWVVNRETILDVQTSFCNLSAVFLCYCAASLLR